MTIADLANLPINWSLVTLEDVCSVITDGTHKTPNYVTSGIRFISIKNIRPFEPINWSRYEKYISATEHRELTKRCKPEFNDILFPRIGTLGFAKRIDFVDEVSIFVGLGLAKPIIEIITPHFLEYWMNHPLINQLSHERANGSGRLTLPLEESRRLPVVLPPLTEQTRIVAKLEELLSDLDAGVTELKAAQKKLALYRQSLLKAAVEGSLTAEWRAKNKPTETGAQLLERILNERRTRWEAKQLAKFKEQDKTPPKDWQKKYPEPVKPDASDLPELPDGWVWTNLDMLGEIASGVTKGTKREADIKVREVPYLRVANVQRGHLDLSEVKTIYATERDIAELTLQAGDILFNEGGDRDKLGRGWVWRNEVADCIHQNHVFRMRPYLPEVLPELISHHGNTFGKTWFQHAGKQTTNLASINMTMLRVFPIPLGPAEEQRELLNQLEVQVQHIDQQEQAVELALKQAVAQRQNILRAAFSGQLVPQDPHDEPASVLLERIRAERAARNPVKTSMFRRRKQPGDAS